MGKTLLCATAPTPIIISAESGLLSLNKQNQQKILGKVVDIPVVTVTNYTELEEAYQWIVNDPHAQQFETICLDSISEIAEKVLAHAEVIIVEVSLFAFRDGPGMPVFPEVLNFMLERKYALYDFPGFLRRPLDGALGQCDVCFVKRNGFLRKSNNWK